MMMIRIRDDNDNIQFYFVNEFSKRDNDDTKKYSEIFINFFIWKFLEKQIIEENSSLFYYQQNMIYFFEDKLPFKNKMTEKKKKVVVDNIKVMYKNSNQVDTNTINNIYIIVDIVSEGHIMMNIIQSIKKVLPSHVNVYFIEKIIMFQIHNHISQPHHIQILDDNQKRKFIKRLYDKY